MYIYIYDVYIQYIYILYCYNVEPNTGTLPNLR